MRGASFHRVSAAALALACAGVASAADWVQTNAPLWGLRDGVRFALHPAGFGGGTGGPRGLVRIGAPVLPGGGHALVNFVAVEPVVNGRRGYSEMERSGLDGVQGRRMTPGVASRSSPGPGVEQLDVPVEVEPFDNGAKIRLVVSQRSDRPDEIRFAVHAEPDSAPVGECIVTATMGNMTRARRLWLGDATLHCRDIYPGFAGDGFAPHAAFPLERLARDAEGGAIAAITGDEADPASVFPFPGQPFWHYAGMPVTQYWKAPAAGVAPDLRVVVNARRTYWQSRQAIPGGPAFENFEMCTRFREGQVFVLGVTTRTPTELGIAAHGAGDRPTGKAGTAR